MQYGEGEQVVIRVVALALVMGAGAPALAVPACQPGTACVVPGTVLVKASPVSTSKFAAPHAANNRAAAARVASTRAAPRGYGREIAMLSGLVVLGLLSRRRRLMPEVVS